MYFNLMKIFYQANADGGNNSNGDGKSEGDNNQNNQGEIGRAHV